MQFKGRSLYNLLKISLKEDPKMRVEDWQVQNYRILSDEELFKKLQKIGVSLTEETFLLYAESCDTPEDLLECLWVNESDPIGQDKAFLLLFELWRRLAPEKQSLSIFCDELDELISLYDEGHLEDEEPLQKALGELEDILDQSIDQGALPQEIFESVSRYMAHDLEEFLYDYILELMEASNELYASELIDGMSPYVAERKWFDLLKARLFSLSNSPETNVLIARILEQAEEEPDLAFFLELGQFLAQLEEVSLFLECTKQLMPLIQTEEDVVEVLGFLAAAFRDLDKEALTEQVESYLEAREKDSKASVEEAVLKINAFLPELA